jgi:hypothetical protein
MFKPDSMHVWCLVGGGQGLAVVLVIDSALCGDLGRKLAGPV